MPNPVLFGFWDLQHLFAQRATNQRIPEITTAVDRSIAEHNRQFAAFMALFVRRTTEYKLRYVTRGSDRLQPLDENGRALPTMSPKSTYDVDFPIQDAGTAWGTNRITRLKMTVEEANQITAEKVQADMAWVWDHMMAALMANASWAFTDKEHGALNIQPLANGDGTLYARRNSFVLSADNHLLFQAAAISNSSGANPFPNIRQELIEHPENGNVVLSLIPPGLLTATEGLADFVGYDDPDIAPGQDAPRLIGRLQAQTPAEIIGKTDGNWIGVWDQVPDNRIISTTIGGEPTLGMREHPEAELQGFLRVDDRNDLPYYESHYVRHAGFGAWNRTGSTVTAVGESSYVVAPGFASPMP